MATTTAVERELAARRPGVFDRLIGLPSTLPGPWWAWVLGLFGLLIAIPTAVIWVIGAQPIGTVDPRIWLPALISAFVLGMITVTDRIAVSSFDHFEPALGTRADKDELLNGLVSMPDGLTFAIFAVVEIVVTIGYFSDSTEFRYLTSRPTLELAMLLITNWVSIGLSGILLAHTFVQLRAVDRLHHVATSVDLFNPGPAHAFARLTAATGIGILILGLFVLGDPTAARQSVFYALLALSVIAVAAATFALPLRGMNVRLSAERARLLHEANARIKLTIARVHAAVDGDDLSRSDKLQQTMASLVAERDLLLKLSTWPWSTNLFRGFASALLVPVVLWLITRALAQVV